MTIEAIEAEVARMRKLRAELPHEYRLELIRGIRNRAALMARFFALGASASMNDNEDVMPDAMDEQYPIAIALQELAADITVAATWLDNTDADLSGRAERVVMTKGGGN